MFSDNLRMAVFQCIIFISSINLFITGVLGICPFETQTTHKNKLSKDYINKTSISCNHLTFLELIIAKPLPVLYRKPFQIPTLN